MPVRLEVLFHKGPGGQPQGRYYPDGHNADGVEQAHVGAEEVFVGGAGVSHQGANVHLQHEKDAAQVDGVERGEDQGELLERVIAEGEQHQQYQPIVDQCEIEPQHQRGTNASGLVLRQYRGEEGNGGKHQREQRANKNERYARAVEMIQGNRNAYADEEGGYQRRRDAGIFAQEHLLAAEGLGEHQFDELVGVVPVDGGEHHAHQRHYDEDNVGQAHDGFAALFLHLEEAH